MSAAAKMLAPKKRGYREGVPDTEAKASPLSTSDGRMAFIAYHVDSNNCLTGCFNARSDSAKAARDKAALVLNCEPDQVRIIGPFY